MSSLHVSRAGRRKRLRRRRSGRGRSSAARLVGGVEAGQRRTAEQAVDERAAERVARSEPADDVDVRRRDPDPLPRCREQDAVRPELDDGEADAGGEQGVRGRVGVVACRPPPGTPRGCRRRRRRRPTAAAGAAPGGVRVRPQRGPVVEVEQGVPGPAADGEPGPHGVGHRSAGERRVADPQRRQVADDALGQEVGGHLEVRRGGTAVEGDGRRLRRVERDDRERGERAGDAADPPGVDAVGAEPGSDVRTEAVVADGGHRRGPDAEPGGGDGDVRRAAPDGLDEGLLRLEPRAGLLRVEVDADPADGDELRCRTGRGPGERPGRHAAVTRASPARAAGRRRRGGSRATRAPASRGPPPAAAHRWSAPCPAR